MNEYTEIFKLHKMLNRADIDHDFHMLHDGFQILWPGGKEWQVSAVEHERSCGHEEDRIEILGLTTASEGYTAGGLTADEVFRRICIAAERPGEYLYWQAADYLDVLLKEFNCKFAALKEKVRKLSIDQ